MLNDALLKSDVDENLEVINDDIVRSAIIFMEVPVHATNYGPEIRSGRRETAGGVYRNVPHPVAHR